MEKPTSGERYDGLPELDQFSREWGLRFPIPPSVALPLEEVMVSSWPWPIEVQDQFPNVLALKLFLPVGREIILAFVEGALLNYIPPGMKRFFPPKQVRGKGRWKYSLPNVQDPDNVVLVQKLSQERLQASIQLSEGKLFAHPDDILREIKKYLPRHSEMRLLTREDYQEILDIWDCLQQKPKPELRSLAPKLRPHRQQNAQAVYDLKRAFQALAEMFGIPL